MAETISNYEMFLSFGYVPRLREASLDWFNCDFNKEIGKGVDDEYWWIREGAKTLKNALANEIAATDSRASHVVLLSGGLDSRVVLGGLMEHVPPSQIILATYGSPGAWDFEIARLIAKRMGLRHELFNLLDEKWDLDELAKAASCLKLPVNVYQNYVHRKINNYFGADFVYWSGFLGDNIGGGRFPQDPPVDKMNAILNHLKLHPIVKFRNGDFLDRLITKIYSEVPWERLDQPKYNLEQQLAFGFRLKDLTRPLIILDDFDFRTPFLNRDWVTFMANVPYKWLTRKYLYRKIITKNYQALSELPAKVSYGLPLNSSKRMVYLGKAIARIKPYIIQQDPYHSHPRTNYVNWTESLRHKSTLKDAVYTTLQDLKKRSILENKDLDNWWRDHLNRKADNGTLLMNLSSLELLLKAGVI